MSSLPRGLFIAFEGGEGVGKTTQIRTLADSLRTLGHDVTVTREPGGSALGAKIRRLLLDPATGEISPRTEALLFAADRAEHVATVILPALQQGHVVITDRYIDSSIAYQGGGRGLTRTEIANLSRWATDALLPDLTILLDLDPEIGRARATSTEFGTQDRIEGEALDFAQAVRQTFLDLAENSPLRYLILDASQDPALLAETIRTAITGEPLPNS